MSLKSNHAIRSALASIIALLLTAAAPGAETQPAVPPVAENRQTSQLEIRWRDEIRKNRQADEAALKNAPFHRLDILQNLLDTTLAEDRARELVRIENAKAPLSEFDSALVQSYVMLFAKSEIGMRWLAYSQSSFLDSLGLRGQNSTWLFRTLTRRQ